MSKRRIIPLTPLAATAATLASAERPTAVKLSAPPPLSVYIHFPWCVRKCPYCDFNSHAPRGGDAIPETQWLDAVLADLQAALPQIWGRRVHSIFIGGGTPSLMSAAGLDRLLTALRMLLPLDPLAEISLEANPGTVDAGRFRDYRAAGANRLSLGVQSFDDRALAAIGRIHGGADARRALEAAQAAFERVNVDLMYALPGQDLQMALADVDTALAAGLTHLSCYHLTVEPNTAFAHQSPPLPDEDSAADMQDAIEQRLTAAGFEHYETAAFARPGQHCVHNLNYWTFGDYLGIGPGAHGKLSSHEGIRREVRHRHPARYLEGALRGDFIQEAHEVSAAELPFEFMMNALRLNAGVPLRLFAERTGLPLHAITAELRRARNAGLLEIEDGQLRASAQGRRFLNDLLQFFLPA